jgi:DNA-binding XRE family transcriptional regulator
MNIGKAIKEIRIEHTDLNQGDFALKIGISQTYMSQIENNKKTPSTELLQKIGEMLNIPMQFLLWFSLTEEDVPKRKRDIYNHLKPTIDAMIKEVM